MANMSRVRDRAMPVLGKFGASLEQDGGFSVRHGSTRGFIRFTQHRDDGPVLITISIPVLIDVAQSDDLCRYVAFNAANEYFGTLHLVESEGSWNVFFEHTILGDYLDEAELEAMIVMTMGTANDLDDEMQKTFGGQRFHEDS